MKLTDFNYNLPEELIAQTPIQKRDESRLMLLDKNTGEIQHKIFIFGRKFVRYFCVSPKRRMYASIY